MSHQPQTDGLGKAARNKIKNISGHQVQQLLQKLKIIQPFLPPIQYQELISTQDFQKGEADLTKENSGGKHVLQEVSIIGHLRRINALRDATRAIELGAGTARLSDRLQKVTCGKLDHILIDRQDFHENHCRDRILKARLCQLCQPEKREKNSQFSPIIERVTVDIGNLQLEKYVQEKNTLCLSKHLCGPACDLTLHSLSRASFKIKILPPAAIATCCHYLCDWDSFAGKDFWKALGLTKEDFAIATAVSQWSSLRDKKHALKLGNEHQKVNNDKINVLPDLFSIAPLANDALQDFNSKQICCQFIPSDEFERTFAREQKTQLGIQLKQLLDLSRAACCQCIGYQNVELIRHTSLSTEDRLLIMY